MDKVNLKKKFSQLLNEIENLGSHEDYCTYEKEYVENFEKFGNQLFEESLGKQMIGEKKRLK